MKKRYFTIGMLLLTGALKAQGVYNNGANIVVSSGTYFVIDGNTGNFRNETSGNDGVLDISGTLKLGGNFTNNVAATDVFGTVGVGSEVSFVGTGTQTIGGTTTAIFNFPKIHVEGTSSLEVQAAKKLTLSGDSQIEGAITLLDNGSGVATYIDNGTIFGSGTYNVQQYLTGAGGATPNGRRWYITSPVDGALSSSVAAAGNNWLHQFHEDLNKYTEITDNVTTLNVGEGYVLRGGANGNVTFSGTAFNTGAISQSSLSRTGATAIANRGFHLVGNPYPSFYDWEAASLTTVSTTMTYRTATAGGTMVYDTYNGTSHVGSNNNGSGAVTRYLPPMQGFWVEATTDGGQVDFSNAGRSHQTATLKSNDIHSLIRLNLTNGVKSDQTIINFDVNAGTQFENFDSKKMPAVGVSELYSVVDEQVLVINTLPTVSNETVVPLTLNILSAGKYNINAEEISGDVMNYDVLLKDNQSQTVHNLTQNPVYNFSTDSAGVVNGRFEIVFEEVYTSSAGISEVQAVENIVLYNVNRQVTVKMVNFGLAQVNVYDVVGRKVNTVSFNDKNTQFEIQGTPGMYTVEVVSGTERKVKKVMIN